MTGDLVHVDDVTGVDLPVEPDRIEVAVRTALETGREAASGERSGPAAPAEISVTLLPRDQMRALNREYHGVDAPTDVLSFRLDTRSRPWSPSALVGDVYVCPAEAEEAAAEHGVATNEEILRLVIHGVLHVLGHDHPDGEDRYESEMFRLQESALRSVLGSAADGRPANA